MINPFSAITSKIFAGVAIVSITFGAIQTVRIEGFLFIKGYSEKLAEANKAIDMMDAASGMARDKQIAVNTERKDTSDDLAKEGERSYAWASRDAGAAATVYIDRWRVREVCKGDTDGGPAGAEGNNPGVSEEMPSRAVLVSEGDVQACTGATAYALEAHNHAARKIEAGIAE
jgi:hypothetical protein